MNAPDLPDDIGLRMRADRATRGLSVAKYAELLGLTPAKIVNLEGKPGKPGRRPKADEIDKIAHLAFVEPLVATGAAEANVQSQPSGFGGVPQRPVQGTPAAPRTYTPEQMAELHEMLDAYRLVFERIGGGPSPVAYNMAWGAPDVAEPHFWPRIMQWVDDVHRELDRRESVGDIVDGQTAPIPPTGTIETSDDTDPGVCVGGFLDADETEEDGLAIVTVLDEPEFAFPDDGIRRVSNGQLRTFKECRRKYWLAYYRRLGLATESVTGAAAIGTRAHRCLAVLYVPDGTPRGDPLAELDRTVQEDLMIVGDDEIKRAELLKEADLVRAMIEGYLEWLAETGEDENIRVIAPETVVEVDARIPNTRLIAKLDVRVDRIFGDQTTRLFMDHKSVGDLTTPLKMLQFDEQMLHYHLVEYLTYLDAGMVDDEADHVRAEGGLYNMLRKVKRTPTANPPFYGRVEVRHNIHTLQSYWLRVAGVVAEIERFEQRLAAGEDPRSVAYPTPTRDCSWKCEFYHVCTMFDDGSRADDMLANYFVTIDPLRRYKREHEGETL